MPNKLETAAVDKLTHVQITALFISLMSENAINRAKSQIRCISISFMFKGEAKAATAIRMQSTAYYSHI